MTVQTELIGLVYIILGVCEAIFVRFIEVAHLTDGIHESYHTHRDHSHCDRLGGRRMPLIMWLGFILIWPIALLIWIVVMLARILIWALKQEF